MRRPESQRDIEIQNTSHSDVYIEFSRGMQISCRRAFEARLGFCWLLKQFHWFGPGCIEPAINSDNACSRHFPAFCSAPCFRLIFCKPLFFTRSRFARAFAQLNLFVLHPNEMKTHDPPGCVLYFGSGQILITTRSNAVVALETFQLRGDGFFSGRMTYRRSKKLTSLPKI